jgi:uncharacterized protein (UPF0335 family)
MAEENDSYQFIPKQDYSKLNMSGIRTPDISGEIEPISQVRFSRDVLTRTLEEFINSIKRIPIEKYEVDLFEVTRVFHDKLHGKEIDIKCVERIHHIQKLTNGGFRLEGVLEKQMQAKIENIMRNHPMVTLQYDVFCKTLDIWNGLLVKWGITASKNYDYRYTGRALNVKMLDLVEMNSSLMTLDIIWISSKVFVPPLNTIANSSLVELARVLHDQLRHCFEVFLMLNPKQFDPNYNIEKTIAFNSKKFMIFSKEVLPEQNLCSFHHTELKVVKGFAKCFKSSNPKIDYAYKSLLELEMAYRAFEKTLIAAILKATGKAEF